jgi:hypothetical protein
MGSEASLVGAVEPEDSEAGADGTDGSAGTVWSEGAGGAGESTESILVRRSTNIVPVVRQLSYNARCDD